jgi:hypothetical protein
VELQGVPSDEGEMVAKGVSREYVMIRLEQPFQISVSRALSLLEDKLY